MDDFFDRGELAAKLYADSPLPRINMQMGISYNLEFHLSYTALEVTKSRVWFKGSIFEIF